MEDTLVQNQEFTLYYTPRNLCAPITLSILTLLFTGLAVASHFTSLGIPGIVGFSLTGGLVGAAFIYSCVENCKKNVVEIARKRSIKAPEVEEDNKEFQDRLTIIEQQRLELTSKEAATLLNPDKSDFDDEQFKSICELTLIKIPGRYLFTAALLEEIAVNEAQLEIIATALLNDLKERFGLNFNSAFTLKVGQGITCNFDQITYFGKVKSQKVLPSTLAKAFMNHIKAIIKDTPKLTIKSQESWKFLSPLLEYLQDFHIIELNLKEMPPFEEKHMEALLNIVRNNPSLILLSLRSHQDIDSKAIEKFVAARDEIIQNRLVPTGEPQVPMEE